MTLYPIGYGARLVDLDTLTAAHSPNMHPEFRRRVFAWIKSRGGAVGIGGGWRAPGTQPDAAGFAPPGKSFHESQPFPIGPCYAALDLVVPTTSIHAAPSVAHHAGAADYGLHFPIAGEPWHVQPIEIRGWSAWVNAGRPDLHPLPLPEDDPMTTTPNPIPAVYSPSPALLAGGRDKVFGLLPDGSVRHLSGPDVAVADALGAIHATIVGIEHYEQCEALDAAWRARRA